MDIPVKYNYHGDRQKCEALFGQARRVAFILDNMMNLGGLQQQTIKFIPYPGALIVARKFFGTRVVDVFTDIQSPEDVAPNEKACICNCNFSVGWIFDAPEDFVAGIPAYSVMACIRNGKFFKRYDKVLASDFTVYAIGERVVLVPYNEMAYICCTDPTGGEGGPRGCMPIETTETVDADEWRTTYRIIPYCTSGMPLKKEQGLWKHNG